MPLIQLQKAGLAFGHIPLLDDVELVIENRERICLVGRNGTGKSTLLNVIAADQQLDSGKLWRDQGIKIAKLAQEVPSAASQSLFDTVAQGLGDLSGLMSLYHSLSQQLQNHDADLLEQLSQVQAEIDQLGAWDASARVDAVLDRLQLPADALMSECSGGIRRRAMLGQALVSEPDLLLLDEPTNHLDIDAITALEEAVLSFPGAVLFITHDRTFIDDLATRIIELDRGQLRSYPGTYAAYLALKQQELEVEATANRKFDKHLAEEEVWIRQGIKARRTRNEGRARRLAALREERRARIERQGRVNMKLDTGRASGKLVIEAEQLSFAYDQQAIVKNFSTTIMRGDRVGIIGANGTGKTTLLKLLLGQLVPDSGTVQQGTQLRIAYFDQERAQLNPELSVRDNLAEGTDQIQVGDKSQHVISYLRDFLFAPERVNSPVKTLSGGERNRLLLAKLFTQPANLLVLDEPTNDLDVETLELLEELLESFDGTLLLVSHDRAFLDSTCTSTLVMEPAGHVGEYVGGYSDWLAQRPKAVGSGLPQRDKPASQTQTSKPADTTQPATTPARLSHNEKRELRALPGKIEKLEARQAELTDTVGQPQFYQGDQTAVMATLAELEQITQELDAAYTRWTDLEERSG